MVGANKSAVSKTLDFSVSGTTPAYGNSKIHVMFCMVVSIIKKKKLL